MDLQKEREAFEKLPDINAILHNSEFGFNEDINQYYHPNHTEHRLSYAFLMGAWSAWQAKPQAIPDGFVLVPKEPSADLVNHGHQVFLGNFNEGGQTGGRSLYFAYKAMIEVREQAND